MEPDQRVGAARRSDLTRQINGGDFMDRPETASGGDKVIDADPRQWRCSGRRIPRADHGRILSLS